MPLKTFDIAVRPTAEEVAQHKLWYEQDYYEGRAMEITAKTEQEAINQYIAAKKGWIHQSEIKFIRAREVS